MARPESASDSYLIKSVVHASRLFAAFGPPGEVLSMADIVHRTGLSRGIVFRLLFTLESCDLIERVRKNRYRLRLRHAPRRRCKIGYASAGDYGLFVNEVTDSLRFAAEKTEGIDLLVLDNRSNSSMAMQNAQSMIREHVDLVIEYQVEEAMALVISEAFRSAGIPMIAINYPHPGATYFGANNYEAGLMGGRYLGRLAARTEGGVVDEILLLTRGGASSVPRSRLTGTLAGIHEVLRASTEKAPVVYLDGDGQFEQSWQVTRSHLRQSKARRTLISGINDNSVLGALRAFEEAGRERECAAVGQNGSPEAREELHRAHSSFVASVAYFPEHYGEALLPLSLDLLDRRFVPPAVFTKHRLLTPRNVDHLYPNDILLQTLRL